MLLLLQNNIGSPVPFIAAARFAVCDAIENWEPLQDVTTPSGLVFRRIWKYDFEKGAVKDFQPTISDLPALQVFPSPSQTQWECAQSHRIDHTLTIKVWFDNWRMFEIERIWHQLAEALFQSKLENPNVPIILDRFGAEPKIGGYSLTFDEPLLNNNRATVLTFSTTIEIRQWNPNTYITV